MSPPPKQLSGGSLAVAQVRLPFQALMNRTTLQRVFIPVVGTAGAVLTGLLALLVVLRTVELLHVDVSPFVFFTIGVFGTSVCSLYTSMCVRVELDLRVVLMSSTAGSLLLPLMPYPDFDISTVLWILLTTSLVNSFLGALLTERFRWVGERFIKMVHLAQLTFLFAAISWSFSDMTVRSALAVYGLIAFVSWQPLFFGACALTLLEAKLDVGGGKPGLIERGFNLYYLEKTFGIYTSAKTHDLCVNSIGVLIYSYWIVDLLI